MKEKNTQKTQDLKYLDLVLLIFEKFLEGKHQGTPNLKILRSRHKKNSRTPWRFTRTPRKKERPPT